MVVDSKRIEGVLRTKWSGANYSERIWVNGRKLETAIERTVLSGIHRGLSIEKLSRGLSRDMEVGYNNAERLVRTELNFVQNKAALDSIESAGLGSYQFLAALDRRTCPVCGSLDGRIFSVEEYSQGETAPPLHVRCRCTICASVEGVKRKSRIAERREKIPGNVTYEQWKAKYIAIFKASNEKKPQYPPYNKANILAKEEYAKLRNIAEANNISLSNVKKFDGGVETLKQLVETLAQYKAVFPNVFDDRYKLTLSLSGTMDAEDFAITRGRIITLNANAYRDVGILQGEYQELGRVE